ncbi:mechanosensitive ion channel [Hyphococcus flavus]|uniref:Small-conductance mechanosensitive channel n=1 Tax=Hyphococcus flavus TaxID=1866326 RepID=A0AAE9ZJY5_9PROT|nr:mechanosensitive ion channel domain-containing protein [Hyphococcus flavus]WDI32511.1 mechanosensitive ion channel [Hyphococcus flavus]
MQDATQNTATGGEGANNVDIAFTFFQGLVEKAVAFLPSVIGALIVLVIGLWVAGRIKKVVAAAFSRTGRIDDTLGGFLSSLVHYGLIALVLITTLGIFGVPTTSFAAIIGAAGLAIGLALQGTLGHVASGVMMLGFRPFDVGDFVEAAGVSGTVKHIGLFTTEMATVDNKKIIIPNGKIFDDVITNYAGYPTRRVDFVFGVSYGDDLNKAMDLIKSEVEKETRAKSDPEPVIAVDTLNNSSVDIICRVWVERSNYFPVKWALTKAVKERFDAEGVSIPFPCRTVYMENAA